MEFRGRIIKKVIGPNEQPGGCCSAESWSECPIDPVRALRRLEDHRGNSRRLGPSKIDWRLPMAEVDHNIRYDRREVDCVHFGSQAVRRFWASSFSKRFSILSAASL